ncbi:hypothetical protein [Mycoplasma sp. OR1901]|uniref:hypothetical protein n=1 Tax=Mycoplasma sp. OR1901 TaxID=2742195 RepID=UPI0015834266|nr:hypothetical protein [Mycoplasma sp. OR1901]QKT05181.1 hypothetical protein HTZ87_00405 [Mycoplasma sp. OR1901]
MENMKKKLKRKILLGIFTVSTIPLSFAISCSSNSATKQEQIKREIPKPKVIEYKTKEITLKNNSINNNDPFFANFINEINSVPLLPEEYNEVLIKIPQLNIQKKFSRQEIINTVIPSIAKTDIKFNLTDKKLGFNIGNDVPINEIEKFLEKEFNNYYVSDKFFLQDLKALVDKADYNLIKNGYLKEEKAIQKNKLNEYQAVVTFLKQWLLDNSMITFSDDVKIVEINYNKFPAWSLNIKLSVNNQLSKIIKLDFKKNTF